MVIAASPGCRIVIRRSVHPAIPSMNNVREEIKDPFRPFDKADIRGQYSTSPISAISAREEMRYI
jgi:hypothetical protein